MATPIRVLLLEDTPSDAELMLRELKRASLDVTARRVETEDEFRQLLTEWPADVILADYSLPTFDGEAALRIAREIAPEVPFIFVSGSIGEERAVLALQGGATDYILKDRMSRLSTAVVRALEERKQRELRHAAQEELRESEVLFRSVAELAGDAILLTEGLSTIVFANEHAAWMFGRPAAELVGSSKVSLLAEQVREEHERLMESLRTGDDSETSLTKKTIGVRHGKEFPLEMSISSWRRHGQLFFTNILRDVSERVATERRERTHFEVSRMLAASRSLTETTPELIRVMCEGLGWSGAALWLLDPGTDRLSCGGAWARVGENDPAIVAACRETTFASGEGLPGRALAKYRSETVRLGHQDFETPHRRLAASAGVTRVTAVPLHVTGTCIGVLEFFERDDSEPEPPPATLEVTTEIATQIAQYVNLIRSEDARVAAAERLHEAQQIAHVGSWEQELATHSTIWSEEMYAILGLDTGIKSSPDKYLEMVHPNDRDRVSALFESQRASVGPETLRFQHRIIRPDGSERTVECRSRIVVGEGGIVASVIGTIQDVTETQAMERKLELAKRIGSLGRVAATIAHEFNNVMMGIEPFAEMIRRLAADDAKILQAAERISVSVRRGQRVTEEILRFTQPAEPELRGVDLREWLRDLGPELRALAGSVRVSIKLPDSPVYIACDAAQLQQVVTNLLLNARDASPEGSEITITLARVGRENAELTVRDEGTGVPSNALEHIFEPLFTTKRTGTGLGLSVARQVVTRHGGSIEVTNVATGGAEFRIVLPATKARPSAASPQPQRTALHLRRILLVEDDDLVSAGLTALLEMEGMAVLVISRGRHVVEAVESFEPDAVILDLTLPDIDGVEVFRGLRRLWPHLPVVFSTGHGGSAELATELSGAHVELLRKPYEIGELLSALQRVAA